MVLQPSTVTLSPNQHERKLEREEPTVFEACKIQGDRTKAKTSRNIPVWPANFLTSSCNSQAEKKTEKREVSEEQRKL